jgi:hypothetical protein
MAELEAELGGADGLYAVFGQHYVGLFANPRMNVLFDTRDKDSAASALEHGKRIAATLLDEVFHTRRYAALGRGFSGRGTSASAHGPVSDPFTLARRSSSATAPGERRLRGDGNAR